MTLTRRTPLKRGKGPGRKPRARGNRFEKEVIDFLKVRGHHVYRTLGSGGYGGSDIQGIPGYGIECKMVEKLNVWAAAHKRLQRDGAQLALLVETRP